MNERSQGMRPGGGTIARIKLLQAIGGGQSAVPVLGGNLSLRQPLQGRIVGGVLVQPLVNPLDAWPLREFRLGPIGVRRQGSRPLAGELRKLLVKRGERPGVAGERLVDRHADAQVDEDPLQHIEPVLLDQELHHERRLVVGKLQVQSRLGSEKRPAQFTDGHEIVPEQHRPILRIHRLAPGRVSLPLFVDRDPLAQPAGHFVLGLRERHDVAEFVPQGCFPVRGTRSLRGRAIGRDYRAEADAEKAGPARKSEGANRKILLPRKDFDDDGPFKFDVVLRGQSRFGPLEECHHAGAVQIGFAGFHAHQDAVLFERAKLGQAFLQRDQVVGVNVVSVGRVHLFGQCQPFLLATQAEQIVGQLHLGRQIRSVEFECLPLIRFPFGEAIFLRELAADQVIDLGVLRPVLEGGFAVPQFLVRLILQMGDHRPQR